MRTNTIGQTTNCDSQRMKDWTDIIKGYEYDNVYLAEAAQTLSDNITYEMYVELTSSQSVHLQSLQTFIEKS